MYLEARAIAGDESYKNPLQDKYVFGDYHEIVDPNEELRKIYNRILSSLGNKQEMIDQLDKLVNEANETANNAKKESEAAKTLAEKVQENIKNNTVEIIESKYPPTTGLKDRKTLWLDISNGKPGILKLWKDGIWDPVVPDVESVKKETLEQVDKDIESTKTELNQKVQSVESKAQEIAGQIVDVQRQVNNKVDQTWIDNQLKDKADKAGVYTKDEIKDGFIGKQIYETDKQGNVQKFQDINTSIGQTNEALTQKAEKSELKKTNEGLSQLEQKTNEIKTTADGTKQTLTALKTQVDNTVIGVRNYVLTGDREFIFTNANETDNKGDALDISKDAYNDFRGKQVYLSFDAETINLKHGTASNNSVGIELKVEYTDGKTSWFEACYGKIVPEGTNRYKRYGKVSQIIEDKEIKFIRLQIFLRSASGTVKMKNFQAEVGNKPSSFKLANEDQVTGTDFTKKTVEIENSIKGVNTTVSNIQSEQGKLTERVTKSEQTADGFKTSIETLTKKDTEISSKLNTVESTVEGTKKTISDVQQTTNDLKKTTTDIKEEAGKISTKLEQVEARTVGGENWLINTGPNEKPQTIGMVGGAQVNKAKFAVQPGEYIVLECSDHTDSFYQFHLDNTKMGDFEKSKDMTLSLDLQNDVHVDFILFQFINGVWSETVQKGVPASNVWKREVWTFNIDTRATGWGLRLRFARNTNSIGKRFRFKKTKLEKGSIPTDFSKSTYELEQSMDGVKTTVTNVQNSQAGFEKRMTTVEQTASGLSSTVSNLNNVVSDQGKKLTEANTKLEQQATAINAKVELKQVEDYVAGFKIPELKQTVNQNKELLLDELANKLATEQFNQKMTLIDNRFTINEQGINAAAKRTEVYTRIQADGQFAKDSYVRDLEGRIHITETNILSTVKKGDIISAINQTAETIKIKAGKIELDGTTIAKYLEAQELRGTTIRTDNGVNYVHIQKQYIRLMESNISRVYLGYYKDGTSQIQPTVVLGGDSDFQDGSVVLSKQPTQGFLGVINGKDSNGDPYFVSSVIFKRSGDLNLNAGMNGNVTVNSGKGIGHYAKGGSFWAEATDGVTLKGGSRSVWMDCQSAIVFNLKGKNMLDIVDYNGDTDLRFQTLTLRNGASSYAGKLQVKSGAGTSFSPVVASNFETSSKRKYKINIRDVQFSALEKIMALNIQQYNLKTDMEQLYEMRMNRQDNDPVLTTNDIQTRYGWIADDESNPECFVTKEKNAAEIYSSIALQIKAFQEEKHAKDAEIEELKEENKQMNRRIEVLEQLLVQNLINKKSKQL